MGNVTKQNLGERIVTIAYKLLMVLLYWGNML